jgi:tetratricopeptide (TPR) repeat protein
MAGAPGTRRLAALAGLALLLWGASAAVTPLATNDVWIHLTTGRLILEEGRVPTVDRYSFTAEGQRYVAHEWLAALLYSLGERAGGTTGVILIAKLAPLLAALACLALAARAAGARAAVALPLGVLTVTVLRHRVVERPELLALVLLAALLWLLWRDRRSGGDAWILALVPIEAVWANVHGSFPLGIGITLLFAGAEAADRILGRRDRLAAAVGVAGSLLAVGAALWLWNLEPVLTGRPAAAALAGFAVLVALDVRFRLFHDPPDASWRRAGRLLAVAAAMGVAVLANPRGAELLLFPFEFTSSVNPVTQVVEEWKPLLAAPSMLASLAFPAYLAWLALLALALAAAAARGRLPRRELGLVLALGLLPLRHARWVALFVFAATPALAALLSRAGRAPRAPGAARRAVAGVFVLLGAAALLAALVALAGMAADVALGATLAVAVGCAALAVAAALRPTLGPVALGAAALGASALTLLALLHGIPELPGRPRRPALGIVASEPVAPAAFMAEHRIAGRLFTEYELAGLVIHRLWPEVRVFIDSRSEVYGPELLREYGRARLRPEAARRSFERTGVDLVLVRYPPWPAPLGLNASILSVVGGDPRWALLYLDDRFALYARRDLGRSLPEPFEVLGPQHLDPEDPAQASPEFEAEVRRALGSAPHSAVLRTALAGSLRAQGRLEEARREAEQAAREGDRQPGGAYLAGLLAAERGESAEARRWWERALEIWPGFEAARRRLGETGVPETPG